MDKRDHREIGRKLNLYHMQKESPGMVFWHENGWIIFCEIENLIRTKLKEYQYKEVRGPLMIDRSLWKKTGHWENFKQAIFTTSSENQNFCIKSMNCPGHILIFNQCLRSYRDLPFRIAEFGVCYRNEPSGALYGLMRVRSFTQDDAHIFCSENQIQDEVTNCICMIYDIYNIFGFKKISVKLSTRPNKRVGNDEVWDYAEKNLVHVLNTKKISFEFQPGEGAFYGPKIEFMLYDYLDRSWQCGTIQLDFLLSKQLGITYIDKYNNKKNPVIIHRAILGSIERFIGIVIEKFSGRFPLWLAPIQVVLINVTDNQFNYVLKLTKIMCDAGIRAKLDTKNEKIGFKIRKYTLYYIPYILVCGDKEIQNNSVSIRTYNNKNLGSMNVEDFISKIKEEINTKTLIN